MRPRIRFGCIFEGGAGAWPGSSTDCLGSFDAAGSPGCASNEGSGWLWVTQQIPCTGSADPGVKRESSCWAKTQAADNMNTIPEEMRNISPLYITTIPSAVAVRKLPQAGQRRARRDTFINYRLP